MTAEFWPFDSEAHKEIPEGHKYLNCSCDKCREAWEENHRQASIMEDEDDVYKEWPPDRV